jgi:hypothetical protein
VRKTAQLVLGAEVGVDRSVACAAGELSIGRIVQGDDRAGEPSHIDQFDEVWREDFVVGIAEVGGFPAFTHPLNECSRLEKGCGIGSEPGSCVVRYDRSHARRDLSEEVELGQAADAQAVDRLVGDHRVDAELIDHVPSVSVPRTSRYPAAEGGVKTSQARDRRVGAAHARSPSGSYAFRGNREIRCSTHVGRSRWRAWRPRC